MSEIWNELLECQPLAQTNIDWLIRKGVPPLALARSSEGLPGPLRRDDVINLPRGGFEFGRYAPGKETEPAYILLAHDRFGEPIDLVAWSRSRVSIWLGQAVLLGEEQAHGFRLVDELAVHPTPLAWLVSERRGVVVLDEKRAGAILREQKLLAANLEHGEWLQKICTAPRPRISVPTIREAA